MLDGIHQRNAERFESLQALDRLKPLLEVQQESLLPLR